MPKRVKAEGSLDADIVIVGEAPGGHELQQNRPFVGPAGKLLDRLMRQAGIARTDCYITNVIKEKPINIKHFIDQSGRGGTKVSEAFKEYERELLQELKESKARIIVPLGNVSLWAVCKLRGITKLRGSILTFPEFPNKRVIPAIHPAACLRQYLDQYLLFFDLARVKHELDNWPPLPNRKLLIKPSFEQVIEFLERARQESRVSFDIETTRTDRRADGFVDWECSCLSLGIGDEAICIPFLTDRREDYFVPKQEREIWRRLSYILEDPGIEILGQNLMFDASFLLKKHKILITNIQDTMVAQNILSPDFPKGLDMLCSLYTREPYYKDEGKQHIKFGGDLETFWRYSAKDSAVLEEIFTKQMIDIRQQGNESTYRTAIDMHYPLLFMGHHGMLFNKEKATRAGNALREQANKLRERVCLIAGEEINPNSPPQLKKYFYDKLGHRPYIKDGKPTVDIDALKRLVAKGVEEAGLILEIRKLSKLAGTYMEMTVDDDSRIRSTMSPAGTKTGRLSSRQTIFNTGGNVQNLPSAFKSYILADPNHLIYNVDLERAENKIVSLIAPEPRMRDAFEQNIDVHSLTGSLISDLPIEEVIRQDKEHIVCQLGNGDRTWRAYGKMANHALNYGLGARKFSLRLEIPEREAQWIIDRYHTVYPGVRRYHKWVEAQLKHNRTLTNILGRKRKFHGRLDQSTFQEAYAHIPQSTVADIINQWGILPLYNEPWGADAILLNQVHDSIVFEIPKDISYIRHATILMLVKENLERPLMWRGDELVINAEFKVSTTLSEGKKIKVDSVESVAEQLEAYAKSISDE